MTTGTIGVVSADLTRYPSFCLSIMGAWKPEGTLVLWRQGPLVGENCNRLVHEMQGDWLWLLGDDHVFDSSTLKRLLALDLDIVAPLCLRRTPPYTTVILDDLDATHTPRPLSKCKGLMRVEAVGSAGMLIKRRVFDKVAAPWFVPEYVGEKPVGEDVYFCKKARAAGFDICVDTSIPIGHTVTATVWPYDRDGQLVPAFDLGLGAWMSAETLEAAP